MVSFIPILGESGQNPLFKGLFQKHVLHQNRHFQGVVCIFPLKKKVRQKCNTRQSGLFPTTRARESIYKGTLQGYPGSDPSDPWIHQILGFDHLVINPYYILVVGSDPLNPSDPQMRPDLRGDLRSGDLPLFHPIIQYYT